MADDDEHPANRSTGADDGDPGSDPDPGTSDETSDGAGPDARVNRRVEREIEDAKRVIHYLKRGKIKPAEEALDALGDELRGELLGRESYVPLLAMTLATVILIPLVDAYPVGRVLTVVMIALILLLTLSRSGVRPRTFRRAAWGTAVGITVGVVGITANSFADTPNRLFSAIANGIFVVLLFITLPAILRKVFLHPRITINTLAAAISGYLLLGLFFTVLYRFLTDLSTAQFFAQVPNGQTNATDYEYFSFITITTVGYGDITPLSGLARAAAVSEAVIGQIFLVTIVARVVSQLGQQRNVDPQVRARYEANYLGDVAPGLSPERRARYEAYFLAEQEGRSPDTTAVTPDAPDSDRDSDRDSDPDRPPRPSS